MLRLDRLRSLVDVYPGVDREDEMVAAFDYCLHGRGGAAPSIDTAMHGLVRRRARRPPAPGLRHRAGDRRGRRGSSPRSASATGWSWVPWRRPGFQLGLDIAAIRQQDPQAIGVILGGHGITAWGATSAECEANSLEIIRTAQRFLRPSGVGPSRSAAVVPRQRAAARGRAAGQGGRDLPDAARPGVAPTPRRSATSPTATSCSTSWPARSCARWPRSARPARTTSCGRRCGRSCVDLPGDRQRGGDP